MTEKIDIAFIDIKVGDLIESTLVYDSGDYSTMAGRVTATSSSAHTTTEFVIYPGRDSYKKIIEPVIEPDNIGAVVSVPSYISKSRKRFTRYSVDHSHPWCNNDGVVAQWSQLSDVKIISLGVPPDEVSN